MSPQPPRVRISGSSDTSRPDTTLRGRPLLFARVAWIVVTLLVLIIFIFGEVVYLTELLWGPRCTEGPTACELAGLLTSENVRQLEELGLSVGFYAAFDAVVNGIFVAVWLAVGALIFWRRSGDRVALLIALFLVTFGPISFGPAAPSFAAEEYPTLFWLPVRGVEFLGFASLALFFCLFPSGRFVPGWSRWLVPAFLALIAAYTFFPDVLTDPLSRSVVLAFYVAFVAAQVYRYVRVSGPVERQQTKWVVFGTTVAVVGTVGINVFVLVFLPRSVGMTYFLFVGWVVAYCFMLMIPVSFGVAVLRSRLWDIDVVINRTLVYGVLTVSVVGLYVLVVGYLGTLFRTDSNLAISLVATGLVAVLFAPLRDRLQRGVNRLMYGERDDPYKVLSSLGERLETTLAPSAVLPTVVESVAHALKLPYAAIILKQGEEEFVEAAEYGEKPMGEPLVVPLTYQKETVGKLILSPRSPTESFTKADLRLLEDLSRQVGVAAYAVSLTTELQRSRERLVTAREEERKRLRRDLHDGVGPQLAALTLKLETARNLLSHDPKASSLLAELSERARNTVSDVRRSVHALRPPALDELGLVSALKEGAAQYNQNDLQVSVEAPESVPFLSAAVEVACYRIVQEAMTNVVRHAKASNCSVRIRLDEEVGVLSVEVEDDGKGIGEDHKKAGVGMHSMRERAEELGGKCTVESSPGGGTLVSALLPCRTTEVTYRKED